MNPILRSGAGLALSVLAWLWAPPAWADGNGPSLSTSPATVSFGDVRWMTTPPPVTVTLANVGGGPLQLNGLTLDDPADFALADLPLLPNVLSAGASQSVQVTFTPSAQMSFLATLTVSYYLLPDAVTVYTAAIPLSGTAGLPSISVPAAVTLQSIRVGRTSLSQYVTIGNTGLAGLAVSGAAFSGGATGEFVVESPPSPTTPLLIAPGGSQDLYLHYTPAAPGARSATLQVTSDDATTPLALIQVAGFGLVAQYANPTHALDFTATPPTPLGTCAPAQDLVITNGGDDVLAITALTFGGAQGSSFQTTTPAPLVVPGGGGALTIPVRFCPLVVGALSGTLVISTDLAPGHMDTVTLAGDAAGLTLGASTTAMAFPQTSVGTTSASQDLLLTNYGGVPLSGFTVQLTGADPEAFFVPTTSTSPPTTLAPAASFTLKVYFNPLAAGSQQADLAVNAAGLLYPAQVALTGPGGPISVRCAPATLDFHAVPVGSSASQGVVCTNTDSSPVDIATAFDGFTSDWSVSSLAGLGVIPGAAGSFGSLALSVTFAPTDVGLRTADLQITAQGNGSLVLATIAVNGSGQEGPGDGGSGSGGGSGCSAAQRPGCAPGSWALALLVLAGWCRRRRPSA